MVMANREMVVDGIKISDNDDMYVIAEIGQNHEGDVQKCKDLFDAAKAAGAHSVKLQKRDNRSLYTKEYYDQPYNSENAYAPTYGEHREMLEFDRDEWIELRDHAKKIGITLFSTAWDYKSADFLEDLDMPAYKIASGDLKTLPQIKYIAKFGKPMFISTGGASIEDVQRVYDEIMPINPNICIMQCTSGYPPTFEELNIRVIETYREKFPEIPIGFSSHDSGIAMAMLGYMCGARVLEKHFTLNRAWKGTDQAFSLEPNGLRRLVRDLQRARAALGDGVKRTYDSEHAPLIKMGKKLCATSDLPAGHTITEADIALKSPGDGIAPYFQDVFIGKTLKNAVADDQAFTFEDIGLTEAAANEALKA
ncbi:MAG TPA: N-acetylneuraminate synthase [Henriciella sp.]|nr:N-acetylneuraminate synthase [Henriciella sp.]